MNATPLELNMSGTVVGPSPQLEDHLISAKDTPVSSELRPDVGEKAIDVVRRHIDQDIEKMEEAIRALKSRRNGLAAISCLPPEVLSKIFVCCAAAPEPTQLTMEWVKVSHVSRHWRAVAIGCPYLWTNLVFTRPRWVEEMLKRSKMASLVIDARLGYMGPRSVEAVHLAMNDISRVRELTIVSATVSLAKLFQSVPKSAPMLQTLVLSGSTGHYVDLPDDNYNIPPGLFGDDTSQLRRLELVHCNLDWTSPLLKGLTHLKIHDTAPGTRPSTVLFLDVLEQLPALKSLDLKDTLPQVTSGSSITSRTVKLPSLTYLHISGSASECSNTLRHLSMSSNIIVKLSCRSNEACDNDFASILTFISGLWEPATTISSAAKQYSRPIRSLQILGEFPEGLRLQTWPTVLSFTDMSAYPAPPFTPSLSLSFQWSKFGLGSVERVITETCAALPLKELVLLDVSSTNQLEKQMWLKSFGKLTRLRSIRVQGASAHTLVSAMTADPGIATGTSVSANSSKRRRSRHRRASPSAVYFPSLLSLTIEDANFDEEGEEEYAELDALKDCLMERFERKVEVRELILNQCHRLLEGYVEELREIVVDVTWDGLESGFTDDEDEDIYGHFGYMGDSDIYDGFDSDDDYYHDYSLY